MLEKEVERPFAKYVESDGNECIKIQGRKHWPDRLVVIEHGQCFYIEFKRPGEGPRKGQRIVHEELRARGHRVYVCDTKEEAIAIYENEKVCAKKLSKRIHQVFSK